MLDVGLRTARRRAERGRATREAAAGSRDRVRSHSPSGKWVGGSTALLHNLLCKQNWLSLSAHSQSMFPLQKELCRSTTEK